MKKLTISPEIPVYDILYEIYVDKDVFDVINFSTHIAASREIDFEMFDLPKGSIISAFADQVSTQMIVDFECFVLQIESLITDVYGLEIAYKNRSKDNSFYYTCFAKDKEGNIVARFEYRIRISNHKAHTTSNQKRQRSAEDEEIRKYLENHRIPASRLRQIGKITLIYVVNSEEFPNYHAAFNFIAEDIENTIGSKLDR